MKKKHFLTKGLSALLSLTITVGLLFTGTALSPTPTVKAAVSLTSADFLKTNKTSIKKNYGNGDSVYLRGTNAGGWLVQEHWMNPTNASDQKTMMNTLKNRFGTTVRDELIAVYEDNYWTEQDFDNCAAMGMSVIRLPFTYMNLCDDNGNLKSNAWNRLDWFVNNCSQRGIYVILDLHGAFGSQNGMDHSGEINDGKQLYWNQTNRSKTLWLWEKIAEHYNGNPAIAAYDILNEPGVKAAATTSVQWDFYNEIYNTIRSKDSDHIIIMESCWDANDLPHPSTYGWSNVAYEYHYYPWDHVTSASGQASYTASKVNDIANHNYGVPTFVGEFTCFDVEDAWKNTMSTYNKQGWHWTTWTYKVTGNSSWGIYNHSPNTVDIYNDSAATIRQKWSTVRTNNAWVNTKIYNVIKSYLPGTIDSGNPSGGLLTDGEYYITSIANGGVVCAENSGSDPLIANRESCSGAWETLILQNNSDGTVSFKSAANNKYVCAVIDEENQLLARSQSIGTWEKFRLVSIATGEYAIQAVANNKYIQSDLNKQGKLTATSSSVAGAWEAFKITRVGSSSDLTYDPNAGETGADFYIDANYSGHSTNLKPGKYNYNDMVSKGITNDSISSVKVPKGYKITLYNDADFKGSKKVLLSDASSLGDFNDKTSAIVIEKISYATLGNGDYCITSIQNGKVVCAENNGSNPLVANRDSCSGAWETLYIENNSDGTVSFKSRANGKYVCAVIDEDNQLLPRSSTIGTWEKFYLEKITDTQYAIYSVANGKYVQINQNSKLLAISETVAGAWEAFLVTSVN